MRVRGMHCPGCGRLTVEYNGNYYCSDAVDGGDRCDWVMEPDLPTHKRPTADLLIEIAHLSVDGTRPDYVDEYVAELNRRLSKQEVNP